MKIAFNVDIMKELGITKIVRQVASGGYPHIKQSPLTQITPFYKHPKAGREVMVKYKNALELLA